MLLECLAILPNYQTASQRQLSLINTYFLAVCSLSLMYMLPEFSRCLLSVMLLFTCRELFSSRGSGAKARKFSALLPAFGWSSSCSVPPFFKFSCIKYSLKQLRSPSSMLRSLRDAVVWLNLSSVWPASGSLADEILRVLLLIFSLK